MAEIQSIKKLSTKNIFGSANDVRNALGNQKETPLYKIFGIANGWKPGEGTYGSYVAFKGEFHAINLDTGEEFRSATCFLPDDITPMLQNALDNAKGQTVKFGLQISARQNERSSVGYEYAATPIVSVVENDAMAELRKTMGLDAVKVNKALPSTTDNKPATKPDNKKK